MRMDDVAARVREVALSFPEAYEDAPWGFPVFKVRDTRMFAWMIVREEAVEVTVKLTREEREIAHLLPYVGRHCSRGAADPLARPVQDALELAAVERPQGRRAHVAK